MSNNTAKPYTKEENTILLTMREEGKSFKYIAGVLGRTEAALWMQYKKLKNEPGNIELKVNGVTVGSAPAKSVESPVKSQTHFVELDPTQVEILEKSKPEKKESKMVLKTIREKEKLTPREMIKSLYDLGYRIENNQLVCYVRQTVNMKDILSEVTES